MYLEYHKEKKQVVEIHEIEPSLSSDYDYAISDIFKPGDEFEWTIWINEVDEDKNVTSYSAIRNNPNAKQLLEENEHLKTLNNELMLATAELGTVNDSRITEIELALAELASVMGGDNHG